ncbi:hypothetical protein [Leptolyngbya sp. DQ-M1]|uniref:hypothetical protein n=1 Tax=Leptolyngbya sp. DQ-M1 TaxID=2933920 RepID=UPI003296C5C2
MACQNQPPIVVSSPTSVSSTQNVYRNDRLRFEFRYPEKDFVVDPLTKSPPTEADAIATVEVWTKEHYQKLKAGAYEGGTEYPANVQVAVYQNPKKLDLQNWVQQNDRFAAPQQFKTTTIVGQTGIAFQSSGLYEHEHIAFQSDDEITLITLSKTGHGNNDATYRTAFDQIIRTFQRI